MLCLCGLVNAKVYQQGNTFKSEKVSTITMEQVTPYFYEIDGVQYPIYRSSKNSFYIKRISKKTNQEYKYYLPKDVQEKLKQLYL